MNRLRLSFIQLALGGPLSDSNNDNVLPFPINPFGKNDELSRIFAQETVPTSMAHPLEVYAPREMLIELVEASLETIRSNRIPAEESEGQAAYVEAAIRQRVEFLSELRSSREEEIYVAIYPIDLEAEAEVARQIEQSEDPEDIFPFS